MEMKNLCKMRVMYLLEELSDFLHSFNCFLRFVK